MTRKWLKLLLHARILLLLGIIAFLFIGTAFYYQYQYVFKSTRVIGTIITKERDVRSGIHRPIRDTAGYIYTVQLPEPVFDRTQYRLQVDGNFQVGSGIEIAVLEDSDEARLYSSKQNYFLAWLIAVPLAGLLFVVIFMTKGFQRRTDRKHA